jgi:hypothetical protein
VRLNTIVLLYGIGVTEYRVLEGVIGYRGYIERGVIGVIGVKGNMGYMGYMGYIL